ncbi:Aspartyl aminopeptidase [Candidatus Syntrophocurvum alkaliphilum]|uniref:M18 family aminopeptidase n=1 Tax=Candidatus Syntrophocurvum alkaliphilum TaxID=2293317 RepID=A0A6I6DLB2_9FIRM|nr:aminopeptidase [Candidatus Syntrophocurvum alkaliphilum]QGU00637.1 Aspartyl aminopeptidase [Candidatus Syntrophocurvum alkaliphilum]
MKKNQPNTAWERLTDKEINDAYNFCNGYKHFLNIAKTEREATEYIVNEALSAGFKRIEEMNSIEAGQKILVEQKGKVAALIVVGEEPIYNGLNIIASHTDSPRLDLKPRPMYEDDGLAFFKTHYYGGIKKYHWLAIPLALHGVVIKKDGSCIKINIGESEEDITFTIADLLPHLAKDQMEKKMSEAISGEGLNALIGTRYNKDNGDKSIKAYLKEILKSEYNIEEDDFTSAELQLVPALKAKDLGFDRSMVAGYGQDDRVSAYCSLKAILETDKPPKTAMCLFVDKEEIGSMGNTGLQSLLIENITAELLHLDGNDSYHVLRNTLMKSYALSADVNAAVDPNYPEVFEKMNNSSLSKGVVLTKYTGSRGKSVSNDANPEYVAKIRNLFDSNNIEWQVGELGKVDIGGGGTVAQYIAYYGIEVVDCGVAILGMHSPFEIASKADIYMSYKAYKAFFKDL